MSPRPDAEREQPVTEDPVSQAQRPTQEPAVQQGHCATNLTQYFLKQEKQNSNLHNRRFFMVQLKFEYSTFKISCIQSCS